MRVRVKVRGMIRSGASYQLLARPYKRQLRSPAGDWMARLTQSYALSYIPYGTEVADPLLSPEWAARGSCRRIRSLLRRSWIVLRWRAAGGLSVEG